MEPPPSDGGEWYDKKVRTSKNKVPETNLVSPGDSLEMGGCRNGDNVRERGGFVFRAAGKGGAGLTRA